MLRYIYRFLKRDVNLNQQKFILRSRSNKASDENVDDLWRTNSALNIDHMDHNNTTIVDVHLGLNERLARITTLATNVKQRQLDLDLNKLINRFSKLQSITFERNQLSERRNEITDRIKQLKKVDCDLNDKFNITKMQNKGKSIREEYKVVNKIYHEISRIVNILALRLPNDLHKDSPETDTIIFESGNKVIGDIYKSHMELFSEDIIKSEFGCFYLTGSLAIAEYRLIERIRIHLPEYITAISSPDMFKCVVLEACNVNFFDKEKVFKVNDNIEDTDIKSSLNNQLYLTGVSEMSFASYLLRTEVQTLPMRCYTIGRSYSPFSSYFADDLLNCSQETSVNLFAATSESDQAINILHEYTEIIVDFYMILDMPIRVINVAASSLKNHECLRNDVETWLVSEQKYIKIAKISYTSDYISRRLMITDNNKKYVHMVNCEALASYRTLACLIENIQNKDSQFNFRAI